MLGKAVFEALPEVAGQGYEQFLDDVYHTGQASRAPDAVAGPEETALAHRAMLRRPGVRAVPRPLDGYDLARRMRAGLPAAAPTRPIVIALTGYGQAHDRELSQAAGFDHHFVKPMDINALAQVLAAVPR